MSRFKLAPRFYNAVAVKASNTALKARITVLTMALAICGAAMATPPPLVDWSVQATELKDEASPAITAAIGVGVVFLAVAIGWKLLRRFAK